MTNKKDYVQPPRQNNDYVAPPKKETNPTSKNNNDYVAPPKKETSPTSRNNNDYVAPPKKETNPTSRNNKDYVASPKNGGASKTNKQYVAPPKKGANNYNKNNSYSKNSGGQNNTRTTNTMYNNEYAQPKKEKIKTPKMGARFYFSGYLVWMLIFVLFGVQNDFLKILLALYVIASNFTLSWYADYQRYKSGGMSWFFSPFLSAKAGAGISLFMGYRTATTKRGLFGSYKTTSSRDLGKTASTFFLVSIFIELFKLIINIPLALVTLFTHQRTLQKYVELVDEREGY